MHYLLTLAYDGTAYAGWQRQQNAIAVQQRVEEALAQLLGHPAPLTAASRTDAGVHALGQRACFFAPQLRVPPDKLPQVLNGLLPPDIAVQAAQVVPDGFNPRFHATHKTYRYQLYTAPLPQPLLARYHAYVPMRGGRTLHVAAMQQAAHIFTGKHDFAAFCATGSSAKTTVREIFHFTVQETPLPTGQQITLTVTGNGFLYNMVRILAGTLLYVGQEKITIDSASQLLLNRDRSQAGKTMPPQGLTLLDVRYKE